MTPTDVHTYHLMSCTHHIICGSRWVCLGVFGCVYTRLSKCMPANNNTHTFTHTHTHTSTHTHTHPHTPTNQDTSPISETYIPEAPVAIYPIDTCTPGPGQRCAWQSVNWPGGMPAENSNVYIPAVCGGSSWGGGTHTHTCIHTHTHTHTHTLKTIKKMRKIR